MLLHSLIEEPKQDQGVLQLCQLQVAEGIEAHSRQAAPCPALVFCKTLAGAGHAHRAAACPAASTPGKVPCTQCCQRVRSPLCSAPLGDALIPGQELAALQQHRNTFSEEGSISLLAEYILGSGEVVKRCARSTRAAQPYSTCKPPFSGHWGKHLRLEHLEEVHSPSHPCTEAPCSPTLLCWPFHPNSQCSTFTPSPTPCASSTATQQQMQCWVLPCSQNVTEVLKALLSLHQLSLSYTACCLLTR